MGKNTQTTKQLVLLFTILPFPSNKKSSAISTSKQQKIHENKLTHMSIIFDSYSWFLQNSTTCKQRNFGYYDQPIQGTVYVWKLSVYS